MLALGSDFDGIDGHHQLETAADMPLLADALRKSGFTEDEVEAHLLAQCQAISLSTTCKTDGSVPQWTRT